MNFPLPPPDRVPPPLTPTAATRSVGFGPPGTGPFLVPTSYIAWEATQQVPPRAIKQWMAVVALLAAFGMLQGSRMTWAEAHVLSSTFSRNGLQTSGVVTLLVAVLLFGTLLGAAAAGAAWPLYLGAAGFALCAGVAILRAADIASVFALSGQPDIRVTIGIGLWITIVTALSGLVACVACLVDYRSQPGR